ncbi:hypothetical protein BJX70DRAFT_387557 [Aspergillus crustosus]
MLMCSIYSVRPPGYLLPQAQPISSRTCDSVPAKGYVFVVFVEPSQGCSLIHENDLELVDRILDLGDPVKRISDDTMRGQVVSATTKCTLEPIAFRPADPVTGDYLSVRFTESPLRNSVEDSFGTGTTEVSPNLLYDVPQSDLKKDEDLSEGDHIIYHNKMGVIQEVERDVVLLLPNSKVVSPLDPYDLEFPIPAKPSTILSFSDLNRRDIGNGAHQWTSEADFVFPGQSVLTKRLNISRGDRPSGSPKAAVQGYVLATPTGNIHVDWICPNVFSSGYQEHGLPRQVMRASLLREDAVICDFGLSPNQGSPAATCHSLLDIGERVRLRDPGAAKGKYPGYQHIPPDQTFGHDLNIFRIVSSKTDLWPGNIVAMKDTVEHIDTSSAATSSPAPYLHCHEKDEILHLQQVGVVQWVNTQEQIAFVRWYQGSDIQLMHGGNALNPRSSLGQLSNTITSVSVYELAVFPALSKFLDDLVVVAPASVEQAVMSSPPVAESTGLFGPCHISALNSATYSSLSIYLQLIKSAIVPSDWFKNTTAIRAPRLRRRYSVHNEEAIPPVDFFGKIVAMGTDGIITVRFPGLIECRDIQVSFERILLVMTAEDLMLPMALSPFELPVSSSVEVFPDSFLDDHEGRSDTGSVADGWTTDEDSDSSLDPEELGYAPATGVIEDMGGNETATTSVLEIHLDGLQIPTEHEPTVDKIMTSVSQESSLYTIVRYPVPSSVPPSFAVLEDIPPADHHFINKIRDSDPSSLRLKRIRNEFEILESSLPPGIFVRSWESRMDILRILIIGPEGTPYEYAPFVIDMRLTPEFPHKPPSTFFHSWTSGQGPVNPNLYEDGKICLSILGTWPTKNPDETWSPVKSTVLQILVSIMGLVLVKSPFYNEAGYESLAVEDSRAVESSQYTEKVFIMTRKFILHALENPVPGLEDVLIWYYLCDPSTLRPGLLDKAIQEAHRMIEHHDRTSAHGSRGDQQASSFCSRLSLGAVVVLQKHIKALGKLKLDISAQIS